MGYLTMFLLIQALFYLQLFSDDKKTGTFRRTAVSPAGIVPYMTAQCLFGFIAVYVPTWSVLFLAKAVGIDIGFGLGTYSLLLVFPALLAVSFALFMAAWIENADTGLSLSSGIILLSSLLSGSFYTIANENGIMKVFVRIFPQQHFISLVQDMELKGSIGSYGGTHFMCLPHQWPWRRQVGSFAGIVFSKDGTGKVGIRVIVMLHIFTRTRQVKRWAVSNYFPPN
ncbi:ABC transporter permease [Paenibacillus larvae]|uniref:ABC transporter permease n=1 Tax=Paenibacillus larvae TaxID=1464 RepID=UPI00288CD32E|nr:ABC transporter permease [Paenibacillus larvae]MDT2192914.1 ABC transporter permease [Paenibacillus larvae]MDT2240212.1 ABC transporter permease [Paenibacillus larvae]MDT2246840.1 ABC transporter permease [Paenibacillus larvae]MDT2256404.1 ABC transporter permease [Paenibacillus larvae]MDT2258769.1 ABC transporter permease [Paenibacillus larvae]